MFQVLGDALPIKIHILKQMLVPFSSSKLYTSLSKYMLTVTEHKRFAEAILNSVPSW